jgi:hypothetical protein
MRRELSADYARLSLQFESTKEKPNVLYLGAESRNRIIRQPTNKVLDLMLFRLSHLAMHAPPRHDDGQKPHCGSGSGAEPGGAFHWLAVWLVSQSPMGKFDVLHAVAGRRFSAYKRVKAGRSD